jgi:hypothetical protein
MLLSRYDNEDWEEKTAQMRPLIVTKSSPRKAAFAKLNRGVQGSKKIKRLKQRAGILRVMSLQETHTASALLLR